MKTDIRTEAKIDDTPGFSIKSFLDAGERSVYVKSAISVEIDKAATDDGDEPFVRTFIMSAEIRDRDGDIVKLNSGNFEQYNRNPIIAWMHVTRSADPDFIIGHGKAFMRDGKAYNTITFEPATINPLAGKIAEKIKFGSIRAGSIGFLAHDGRYGDKSVGEDPDTFYITDWELLEFSIVSIPSNSEAMLVSSMEIEPTEKSGTPAASDTYTTLDYRTAMALLSS
jgi:hypothetical protein